MASGRRKHWAFWTAPTDREFAGSTGSLTVVGFRFGSSRPAIAVSPCGSAQVVLHPWHAGLVFVLISRRCTFDVLGHDGQLAGEGVDARTVSRCVRV